MALPVEQLKPFEIHDDDDVWNALYIFGVKDSLEAILRYYGYETGGEESGKRFRQVRTKDLENFFSTLDPDQQEEVLKYFVGKKDKNGLVLFYQSLGQSEQRAIVEKMLFETFETRSDEKVDAEIRKLRKRLFGIRPPANLDEAINAALQDNPGKAVLFLKEHMFEIPKFIDTAPEDVTIAVLLEMLRHIPN